MNFNSCAFWISIFVLFKAAKPMTYKGKKAFHCRDTRFSIGSLFNAQNIVLFGFVRKAVWTSNLIHCNQLCLAQQDWCISVNFNTTSDEGKNLCELNHYGVEKEEEIFGNMFEKRNGFVFNQIRPFKYGCSGRVCQNGGSCYYECASSEIKCRCTEGFYGTNCEHSNQCQKNVCQNGGSCQDLVNNFTCSCVAGYTGRLCDVDIDDCQEITCQNGASCQDSINNFTCSCVSGFTGRLCETNIDDCQKITCQNGGSCQDLTNNFTCSCVAGYTGRFCETDIDDCQKITCQNGGSCQDLINNFTCSCVSGFTGRLCETNIDDCQKITCQNGGSCQDLTNNFTCSCVAGYTGRLCETDNDDCQEIKCQNGGKCQDLINNFTCSCVSGFTGRFCETDIDECASNPCLNGGTCLNQVNKYFCTCPSTHHGLTCNKLSTCDITFRTYSTSNVIIYPWSTTVYAMTFCTWVQLTSSSSQYPASDYGLGVQYKPDGTIYFRIHHDKIILKMGIKRDGNWQHLCIAWRNTDGGIFSYRNGQLVQNKTGFKIGGRIVGGGNLNICRRSDLGGAFVGNISNFNIWSSFLSAEKIKSMSTSCQPLSNEGEIVRWSEVKKKRLDGEVSKVCPGTCYV